MAHLEEQQVNDWLDLAVDRIEQMLHPKQVLLFGSWARGTPSRHSDLDLLIIWETHHLPLE